MLRFIIRRLLITIPTVLIIVTVTWGLIRLAPGNFYTGEKRIPPAIEKNIREKYGLDKPWYAQYGKMMGRILRFRSDPARARQLLHGREAHPAGHREEHPREVRPRQALVRAVRQDDGPDTSVPI